jgi:hypothetical protein
MQMQMKMSMERWWKKIEMRKPTYLGKDLFQCQFVHHQSHVDRHGIEVGLPQ